MRGRQLLGALRPRAPYKGDEENFGERRGPFESVFICLYCAKGFSGKRNV